VIKIMLAVFLFAAPTFAQDAGSAALAAAGCGSREAEFNVKVDKKQHPLPQPEPGKAVVAVVSLGASVCIGGCLTTRVGIDGAWVGANQGHSYLFFSIEPGDHRLCVAFQSSLKGRSETASAVTLTAEAGQVYYARAEPNGGDSLKLKLVDSAEGPLLLKAAAFSTSQPKKP
jgi:hypothetical protein